MTTEAEQNKALILSECDRQGVAMLEQRAYILATVQHETAGTFMPVREAFWLSEDWRRKNLRYYPFYGRGFVQLTWRANYAKFGTLLGLDLVNEPDLVMKPDTSAFILVYGFVHGAFTGRKIADYISAVGVDFIGARRCINGQDRAEDIAQIAESMLATMAPTETEEGECGP